jgi:hypothetical protein
MEQTRKRVRREPVEDRFGLDEWFGAVVALGAVMAGAAATLALAYWLVFPR